MNLSISIWHLTATASVVELRNLPISPVKVFERVHQLGVNCLDWEINGNLEKAQEPLSQVLMSMSTGGMARCLSGGDDNSITYHEIVFCDDGPYDVRKEIRCAKAHASSLKGLMCFRYLVRCIGSLTACTGIAFLSPTSFLSTSTDQRVILWHIDHEMNHFQRMDGLIAQVADVADLDILVLENGRTVVAVSGAGLEMLEVE